MGKSLVFIVVLVMVLTGLAVNGLINAPKRAVEAAGVQVDVDREAAELAAEVPGMPALAAARQARELEDIQRERERAARDWWAYQQAQDEQLRLTRAQNDLTIASGEWSLARRAQLSEWGIYLAAFAAAMSILLVSYVLKRVVDRRLPAPRSVALPPRRGVPAGGPGGFGGPRRDGERPLPV